jgi:hypothetical protein
VDRAIALVERHGGFVEGDSINIKTQVPLPAQVTVWDDYGTPQERVSVDDARWTFRGDWEPGRRGRRTGTKGAEATIGFEGTGAILAGSYMSSGGTADIYLDGRLHRTVDVYSDEEANKHGESVWHAFGLENGEHRVRVVVNGEPYRGIGGDESKGTEISLSYLVVFR